MTLRLHARTLRAFAWILFFSAWLFAEAMLLCTFLSLHDDFAELEAGMEDLRR